MIALFRSGARTAPPRQQHSRTARRSQLLVSATTAGILIGTPFAGGTAAAAARAPAETASVVADWNAIAVSTLAGDTTKLPQEGFLYLGFVHAAVYDAVVGARGRYQPYRFAERAPHGTSA